MSFAEYLGEVLKVVITINYFVKYMSNCYSSLVYLICVDRN